MPMFGLWVIMPRGLLGRSKSFEGTMILQDVGIHLQDT